VTPAGIAIAIAIGRFATGEANSEPVPVPAPTLFLSAFPTESRLARPLFASGPTEITLQFDAASAGSENELVRRQRIAIAGDGRLVTTATGYPVASDKPVRQHTRPSFLIDYDQPVFKGVLAQARAELGAKPSADDVTAFVDRFITKKGMARGYDIASVVAARHEGDCTEHAVLLTALARSFKLPARVASGIVMVEVHGKPMSFGHAWAEIYRDRRWEPADAAFRGREPRVYLPLELLSDEGPGYGLAMMKNAAGSLGVRRVIVAEPAGVTRPSPTPPPRATP